MDLLSTIVHFQARQSLPSVPFTGCQVQGWFLREVNRHNPDLSERLHQNKNGSNNKQIVRPYTLSGLFKGQYPVSSLRQGEWYWARITSLTRELTLELTTKILPDLLPVAKIGQAEFDVKPWSLDDQKNHLTCVDSYENLSHYSFENDGKKISLDYISPTSFKRKNRSGVEKDIPLPVPEMVFGNYMQSWEECSGVAFPEEMGEFIEEHVALSEMKVKSERIQTSYKNSNRATTGFVGNVKFIILGGGEKSRFGADWEVYTRIIHMLSFYAYYCGTGHHTTIGLGQTQPIY